MKKTGMFAVILAVGLMAANYAAAGSVVYSGTKGYERISKGVFNLGLDNWLLVSYFKTKIPSPTGLADPADTSTLAASYMVGLTPRYYMIDNLSLGLSLNFFYGAARTTVKDGPDESTSSSTDLGFIGFLMFNYNFRVGHSLFWMPGLGVGGFYGWRSYPTDVAGVKLESKLYGGAFLVQPLTIQFYAGPHFNLRAGPDLIIRFGQEKPSGSDGQTYISVEAGISAGIGYSF